MGRGCESGVFDKKDTGRVEVSGEGRASREIRVGAEMD